jgi:P27 family predicted phage terminase small subunit
MAPKLITNDGETLDENEEGSPETDPLVLFGPVPPPPDWMGFEAKLEWIRSAEDLHFRGKLVGGAISLLENYCIAIGYVRELEQMLQEDGKIISGKPHPAYKMLLDTMNNARSLANEIGFTKKQVVIASEPAEDEGPWKGDKSLLD